MKNPFCCFFKEKNKPNKPKSVVWPQDSELVASRPITTSVAKENRISVIDYKLMPPVQGK